MIAGLLRRKGPRRGWTNTVAATGWGESTFAELAWDKSRGAAFRWGVAGAVVGALIGLIAFAPAAWLAKGVASATDQRLLLSDARGTVWSGSAVPVLTGGPGSRDASALPGRLDWTLGVAGLGFEIRARHACCLNGTTVLRIRPGFGRMAVTLVPPAGGWVGQWPSAWLSGLGTPFNTLQLGGALRLTSPGITFESAQGRWLVKGRADVELIDASSRLSTLDSLGSYRLTLAGDPAQAGTSQLTLSTMEGALQLSGSGTWGAAGVRFRGEARAASGDEAALSNLLNIIGRRDGARSVISIG
ncbi:type II secretion system protein N [Piscinibacter sp.]|uniref:type II secretion system protein N n=1 Tax=Piscinibacter sp. TaxID=1903157 RepID=UPI002BF3725D|nr:type II secretion system protein N [Albitalea sp.]HUG24859.1 type II secretion system protein N [Albitalea sp.]